MKKVGKTARLFQYDLNQILSDYTMRATSRFKGLCLVDRVPEELWMEFHNMVQEAVTNTFSKRGVRKKKHKKATWLSGEVLEIAEEGKKGKARK